MSSQWDAATYDRIADPMTRWGAAVMERLDLQGSERVLDAGCGSGRVTELLAERLPGGQVVALDASTEMLEHAATRLERFGEHVELVHADLSEPLPIEPVDAVLSTATFHWIPDHDALYANLAAALRPGGQIEAQCGGSGSLERLERAIAAVGHSWSMAPAFPTPEIETARLARAGFTDISCRLREEPTDIDPAVLETYLRTVCLRGLLEQLPASEHDAAVHDVAEAMPEPRLDYVRLEISARRSMSR